jgi:hypothetical protein
MSQLAKLLSPLVFLLIQLRLTVLPSGHFPRGFHHKNLYANLFTPIHATYSAQLIVLGVVTLIVLSELYKPRSCWVCSFIRLSSLAHVCTLKHISGVSYSLQHGHKLTDQLNCFYVTMTATLWQVQPMTWHLCHLHVILSVINKRKYPLKHNTLISYQTVTLNCCFGRHIFVCWWYRKTQRDSSDNRKVIFNGELLGVGRWTIPATVWAEKTTEIVHIPSQEQPMCRFQFKAEVTHYNTQTVEGIVRMLDTLALSPYQPPSMSPEVIPQTTVQAHIYTVNGFGT